MTHLVGSTLLASFTIVGQDNGFKLPNTTNTQNVMHHKTSEAVQRELKLFLIDCYKSIWTK